MALAYTAQGDGDGQRDQKEETVACEVGDGTGPVQGVVRGVVRVAKGIRAAHAAATASAATAAASSGSHVVSSGGGRGAVGCCSDGRCRFDAMRCDAMRRDSVVRWVEEAKSHGRVQSSLVGIIRRVTEPGAYFYA